MRPHGSKRGQETAPHHEELHRRERKSNPEVQATEENLFTGLKVIDCANFIAAPSAATALSNFGAHVNKVEPPDQGDAFRNLCRMPDYPVCETNPWMLESRNKRNIAVDLKSPDGFTARHLELETVCSSNRNK